LYILDYVTGKKQMFLDIKTNVHYRYHAKETPVSTHPYTQPQIAQAVHQAVCTHTGTDGLRCCRFYAVTGLLLLRYLGHERAVPQSGMLGLQPDPADTRWLAMDPAKGLIGEPHCWVALPDGEPDLHPGHANVQLIDFAARHYARYVEDSQVVSGAASPRPTTCGATRGTCRPGSCSRAWSVPTS
jgi:hypothetical protein